MVEGMTKAEQGDVEAVGQGGCAAAVVRVGVGDDNGLGCGLKGLQGGNDIFLVSVVGRARVNDDNFLPTDEIGVCPRPGHGRRVGRDQPPDVGVSLGEGAFDNKPPGNKESCQV